MKNGLLMNRLSFIPDPINKYIRIYLTVLGLFTAFRLILFITQTDRIISSADRSDIIPAFIMGLRFDLVISGYILILPFIVSALFSFFNHIPKIIDRIIFFYVFILFTVAFMVCAVDIPYFNQFFARFSITAFEWFDSPVFIFKMIIQEPRYWLIILPLIIILIIFYKIIRGIFLKVSSGYSHSIFLQIILSVIFTGLIFLGIRGRIEQKSPIRIGTAYFSNNAFLNQLGLNPNFTLIKSYLESKKPDNISIKLMKDDLALDNVQKYLGIENPANDFPIMRQVKFDGANPAKHNVVIIIMEGMSTGKTAGNWDQEDLTPFLDSISKQGYCFENAYTAGIHTFNGVYSTLFSYPALFRQHSMKGGGMLKYHGLFSTLKEHGYATAYFTTHDGQFDNIEGFLKANDCDRVVSKPDYPSDKVKTTLGVPDDYMFEFSIPVLNKINESNKPFCAAFMTASDHGPYYIPEYFKPTAGEIRKQLVEYADYSLRKMIDLSSKQKWFSNTLFVFMADHGAPLDGLYDLSLDYNHSPLIFYAPGIINEPRQFTCMAGQIDIFPSIMGLLKLPYANNTLGIDLFHESRPYVYFSADDKYGVIDNDWFLIVRKDNSISLHRYRSRDTHNFAGENADVVNRMNEYARSNLQAAQYIIRTRKQ